MKQKLIYFTPNLFPRNTENCTSNKFLMNKKIDKEKAVANLRQEAHKRVTKDEVMKFRLESETLEQLLLLAQKQKKPAGALVREWVLEKLAQEENGHQTPEIKAISIITTSLAEQGLLDDNQLSSIRRLLAPNDN